MNVLDLKTGESTRCSVKNKVACERVCGYFFLPINVVLFLIMNDHPLMMH